MTKNKQIILAKKKLFEPFLNVVRTSSWILQFMMLWLKFTYDKTLPWILVASPLILLVAVVFSVGVYIGVTTPFVSEGE